MSELAGHVRAALAADRAARPADSAERMGYFTAPFRPATGPLAGHVLKPYRIGRDPEVLEPLLRRHEAYVECLTRVGLILPDTRLILLDEHGQLRPVVVQEAVPREALMTHIIERADIDVALDVLEQVSLAVCKFWSGVAQRPERIGLHTSVNNFALDGEAGPVFFDTFPPLIGQSREDMGRLIHRFSESGLIRGVGTLLPGRVREIQDPWYTLPGNLALLTEGVMRLRSQDRSQVVDWARRFASTHLQASDRSALLTALARPRPSLVGSAGVRRFGIGLRPHA